MSRAGEIEELRSAYREIAARRRVGCPGEERLAELATGELAGEGRRSVADHVVDCPSCAGDYRLLVELHTEAERLRRRSRRRLLLTWAAGGIAAAALIAAVGLALLPGGPIPEPAVQRAPDGAEIAPPEGAVLLAPPARLSWPAVAAAAGYRVELYDAGADSVWRSETVTHPAVELPAAVRTRLRAGESYFWTVDAEGPALRRRLGPYWFRLAEPR